MQTPVSSLWYDLASPMAYLKPLSRAAAILTALLSSLPLSAEAPGEIPAPNAPLVSEQREHQRVRLVLLPTTVITKKGRPVQGLEVGDFELTENGIKQEIEVFGTETDLPVAVAFLLDLSGSMGLQDKLDRSKAAIREFVESLGPNDRFGLICFAESQVVWITEFTSDREEFLARLDVQEALGPTALYDALAESPRLVDEQIRGRKAIVLFTDGLDNHSQLSTFTAMTLARQVKVPIYILNFIPVHEKLLPRRGRDSLRVLERFSRETGGAIYALHRPKDMEAAVSGVRKELKFQYVLGYYPSHDAWDGSFRSIRLRTTRDDRTVRTRRGYYADP